jgi:hypothetical protein
LSRAIVVVVLVACSGEPYAPDASGGTDGAADGAVPGAPTAAELLAKLATCNAIGGPYSTDATEPATVSICGLPHAVFWRADLDVDCDGKMSAQCNSSTDPDFQDQTAATDSHGDPLDAAMLPYVVVPGHSGTWDYRESGLKPGSVFAVIYQDKVAYGVFGDIGPTAIVGEASYAMAQQLGIDPDPSTGGAETGVAYIGFSGDAAVADPIEDHALAVSIGIAQAKILVGN